MTQAAIAGVWGFAAGLLAGGLIVHLLWQAVFNAYRQIKTEHFQHVVDLLSHEQQAELLEWLVAREHNEGAA